MRAVWDAVVSVFRNEPTYAIGAVGGVVDAGILVAITFGAPITDAQKQALDALVLAVGTIVTLFAIRTQVQPTPPPTTGGTAPK